MTAHGVLKKKKILKKKKKDNKDLENIQEKTGM